MSLGKSLLFASVMTLMEALKEQEKNTEIESAPLNRDIEIEYRFDSFAAKASLSSIASDLFDDADKISNTTSDLDAEQLVVSLINGVVFECINEIEADSITQQKVYDYALAYCNIRSDFSWDMLHSADHRLRDMLLQLSNVTIDAILTASSQSGGNEKASEFIKLFVDLMLHTESELMKQFSFVVMTKRLPIVALDKFIAAMKREMGRMEKEDPSLLKKEHQPDNTEKINSLRNTGREALALEEMGRAAAYFRELRNTSPDDWEAIFYSEFCSVYMSSDTVITSKIADDSRRVSAAVKQALPRAKKQILSNQQMLVELGEACAWISKLAANYFVATMNEFKASSGNQISNVKKSNQVYWIIQMMFSSGAEVETVFADNYELCRNLCSSCWKIGFDCYENCNMDAPDNIYDYYQRLLKYDPSFRCSKPLVSSNPSNGSTGGCYVATAVYGSYDCPQVWTLRRFRDFTLKEYMLGRVFIRLYYATSPSLVRLFGSRKLFTTICRGLLDKLVAKLQKCGYKNTPYEDNENNTEA